MKNFKTQDEFINKMREITGQKRRSLSGHSFEIRGDNADLKYKTNYMKSSRK